MTPRKEYIQRYCPQCGQTDRFRGFGSKHYATGKQCSGVPIIVTYRLVEVQPQDVTTMTETPELPERRNDPYELYSDSAINAEMVDHGEE